MILKAEERPDVAAAVLGDSIFLTGRPDRELVVCPGDFGI